MNNELIFQIVNTAVLPMWLMLLLAPNNKVTKWLIKVPLVPLVLAVCYVILVIPGLSQANPEDFQTLKGLTKLFATEDAVLAGWIHYLVFDLAVGMWLVVQNRTVKLNKWIMVPILLFTFMMGPAGFLLFHLIKWIRYRVNRSRS